ncbi:integrin beta-PS-like [Lycorma delicatula]|uniref:integrin beta-PS-like n=1 Tax=Lycorma delicatula TaxID=130591 RepID=UPI003F50F67A
MKMERRNSNLISRPFTSTVLFVFILFCDTTFKYIACQSGQISCKSKQYCNECVQTPSCAWCTDINFKDSDRCFQYAGENANVLNGKECSNIYYPKSSIDITVNKNLTKKITDPEQVTVQIAPQKIELKLRLNKKETFKFYYQKSEGYPVDLYFLMDLSKSMDDDKAKLSSVGETLANSMKEITSNFRLGFGSFVDKPVIPFVYLPHEIKAKKCAEINYNENDESCDVAYGFRNNMPLNNNTAKFSKEVTDAKVSSNVDSPEGGLDALIQVIVCKEEIGWRDSARHLIIFSTDAAFHIAGDGRLGGVIQPNDGECHLYKKREYTHSTILDYPSIGQVIQKIREHSMNVIFAVTESEAPIYEDLASNIVGSSVGLLEKDSNNIVDIVRDKYAEISGSIEMNDNAPEFLSVTYRTQCTDKNAPLQQRKICHNLKVEQKIEFEAEIELSKCPSDKNYVHTFQIYPVGINERLEVRVEMLCDCECEHEGFNKNQEQDDIKFCHNSGKYQCGVCRCNSRHYGRGCECNVGDTAARGDKEANVIGCKKDANSTINCSGRGQCICNKCECERRSNGEEYYGNYCECDNFSCARYNNLLCNGEDHGTCDCGQCICKPGWENGPGNSPCTCTTDVNTCIAPSSDEICTGNGVCKCGQCVCNKAKNGIEYSGPYCDRCATCNGRCKKLRDCVKCKVYNEGPSTKSCNDSCPASFELKTVDSIEKIEKQHEYKCPVDIGCSFFIYYYENNKLVIVAEKKNNCPKPMEVAGFSIAIGVVSTIVLIGLACLIGWKVITMIQDKREYSRFEKQRALAKWNTDENPLYKKAQSTFSNPVYCNNTE